MIGYKDIKKSINSIIKSNFAAKVNSKDVKEGFERPSFFVDFNDVSITSYELQTHHTMTVVVYYFPSDRTSYSIELLDIQEKLYKAFDLKLEVKDRQLDIDAIEFNVIDGVLEMTFELSFYNEKEDSKLPVMKTLEI